MTSLSAGWVKFFKDAGIPNDLAARYAVMFCDHRIQKEMLSDLDRDILSDIGILAVGDKMAILKHAKFVVEQARRDKSSKLLADGIKTLESRTSKPSTPASRMITHSMNRRDYSPNGKTPNGSPKPANDDSEEVGVSKKSVFERLGQDTPSPKKTGVFQRLDCKEVLPYAGILKKPASPITVQKEKAVLKVKAKSTSVLDRLGSVKEPTPDSSTEVKKVATGRLRLKKATVTIKKLKRPSSEEKPITITQTLPKPTKRPSNVLDRLGDIVVTSTTKPTEANSSKIQLKKKVTAQTGGPKKTIKLLKLKRKSTGDIVTTPPKKPISSNTVSSTSSAGLFRGGAKGASSVFDRLGKK